MLETAVALAFAHVLADFLLQSDAMIRHKRRAAVLAVHVGIVVAASWVALGFAPLPLPLACLAVAHFLIDWLKLRYGRGFAGFLLDQAAHLVTIVVLAALFPAAWSAGLWGLPAVAPSIPRLPEAMALATGLIVTIWGGGYAIASLMKPLTPPSSETSLPRGGRLIGRLERLLIFLLVLHGQPDAIGFLIAAKSILRFGEVSREGADGEARRISEYVIIGTLASFAWAIVTAYATLEALAALRAP